MRPENEITFIFVESGNKRRKSNASSINRHIARATHARRKVQNPAKPLPPSRVDGTGLPTPSALTQQSDFGRTELPDTGESGDTGGGKRTFWKTVLQAVDDDNGNEQQEVEVKVEMEIEPPKASSHLCLSQTIHALDIFRNIPGVSTPSGNRHGRYIDGLDLAILL
ncbi:hypothetical protein PV04_04726 [Phialophora macrospora]|uniref:Uncharacterized protein n=1 Tax=Phialophora macrospora TaxID=1851006 RepID=A0A0D2FQF7_9EURO|nr:hypothetical protein PV04_04726 [Phialophora macrospora]